MKSFKVLIIPLWFTRLKMIPSGLLFMVLFMGISSFASDSYDDFELNEKGITEFNKILNESKDSSEVEDGTSILGDIGMTSKTMKEKSKKILDLIGTMTDDFEVSNDILLTLYTLKLFSEIGEYQLDTFAIKKIITLYERLNNDLFSDNFHNTIDQIRLIRFGKRKGKNYCQFFTKDEERGIIIISDEFGGPLGSVVKKIENLTIENGATFVFDEVKKESEKTIVRKFLRNPVPIFSYIPYIDKVIRRINPAILDNIDDYLEQDNLTVPPLIVNMTGLNIKLETNLPLSTLSINLKRAFTFPGLKDNEKPIPSVAVDGYASIVNLKVSIDR